MQWLCTRARSPSQPFPGHPSHPGGQPKTPGSFWGGSPSPDTSLLQLQQRLIKDSPRSRSTPRVWLGVPFPISTPECPQLSQIQCPCTQTMLCTTSWCLCPCPGRDGQSHSSRDTETFKETPGKAFPAAPLCFPCFLQDAGKLILSNHFPK